MRPLSAANRRGLIEAPSLDVFVSRPIRYPRRIAAASLKLRVAGLVMFFLMLLSAANRRGLIEAVDNPMCGGTGFRLSAANRRGLIEAARVFVVFA